MKMKKIKYIALLITPLLFSCEKEEVVEPCKCEKVTYIIKQVEGITHDDWVVEEIERESAPCGKSSEMNFETSTVFYNIECTGN